jgi:hypothetical protein
MVIADTGFFVALLSPRDTWHSVAKQCHQKVIQDNEEYITTCAVLTETMHLLRGRDGSHIQQDFLAGFRMGMFQVFELKSSHGVRLQELMQKYRDLPMDLADASLVILAEHLGHGRILSTDQRDFGVYRWKQTYPFVNLMFYAA